MNVRSHYIQSFAWTYYCTAFPEFPRKNTIKLEGVEQFSCCNLQTIADSVRREKNRERETNSPVKWIHGNLEQYFKNGKTLPMRRICSLPLSKPSISIRNCVLSRLLDSCSPSDFRCKWKKISKWYKKINIWNNLKPTWVVFV